MECKPPCALMVFVDGLGLGSEDPAVNPVQDGGCPFLSLLLKQHAVPVDACLDVPGIPQSATGQTALLTGVNAPKAVGRHVEGFPGPELKAIIEKENIFSRLLARGYTATFANAYFFDDVEQVRQMRRHSVTTVSTLQAFGQVRDAKALLANKAVYQDLTREKLRPRGYTGPLLTPAESAGHLMDIAREHDFSLFEFFQTDLAAHSGSLSEMKRVLGHLDEFLRGLRTFWEEPGNLFILTSDHGNIEDATTRSHTRNPVPFVALGEGAEGLKREVKTLADFVPAVMKLFPGGGM
ncbi:MAG: peptidase [Lentisphaerota bacterium]